MSIISGQPTLPNTNIPPPTFTSASKCVPASSSRAAFAASMPTAAPATAATGAAGASASSPPSSVSIALALPSWLSVDVLGAVSGARARLASGQAGRADAAPSPSPTAGRPPPLLLLLLLSLLMVLLLLLRMESSAVPCGGGAAALAAAAAAAALLVLLPAPVVGPSMGLAVGRRTVRRAEPLRCFG